LEHEHTLSSFINFFSVKIFGEVCKNQPKPADNWSMRELGGRKTLTLPASFG
jgi:hypothetical protein